MKSTSRWKSSLTPSPNGGFVRSFGATSLRRAAVELFGGMDTSQQSGFSRPDAIQVVIRALEKKEPWWSLTGQRSSTYQLSNQISPVPSGHSVLSAYRMTVDVTRLCAVLDTGQLRRAIHNRRHSSSNLSRVQSILEINLLGIPLVYTLEMPAELPLFLL
jgi:hypothetical protein